MGSPRQKKIHADQRCGRQLTHDIVEPDPPAELPAFFSAENLKAHMSVEQQIETAMPISFGTIVTNEDAEKIVRAYNYLRAQGY